MADSTDEVEQLRRLNEFKSNLLNTAAHELNTPLTPLRLQLHLLKSGSLGEMPPAQERAVQVLDRNVQRLSELVASVLDVARLENGRLAIHPEPRALQPIVQEVWDAYADAAARVGVEISAEVEPMLEVHADADRVIQVLFNLVSNAVKFTKSGGKVTIEARKVGGMAQISVKDSGAGMNEKQMARLFQPFERVHDENAVQVPGTGLGLYIAKGIVEDHGGEISVASGGLDQGSTFTFTLPLSNLPLALHAKPRTDDAVARRIRELI